APSAKHLHVHRWVAWLRSLPLSNPIHRFSSSRNRCARASIPLSGVAASATFAGVSFAVLFGSLGGRNARHCLQKLRSTGTSLLDRFIQIHSATSSLRPAHWALIAWVALAGIYWGNVFRFHPLLIDRSYDGTAEQVVVGRLARSAADGLTSENGDLGINYFPSQ